MGTSKKRGNGEGTIFKRIINGNTYWIAEYTIEMYDKNGKRKRKTISGKTRQEVKNKLENLITELKTDTYIDKSSITFKEIAKEFIENGYKMNKFKESSYIRKMNTYKSICNHYMADMELQKITENDIRDFLIYITKYSNSVIAKIYGIVNNTFKIAVRRNIIRYNFLDDQIEFGKPLSNIRDKSIRAFTIEEQKKFISAISTDTQYSYKYQFLISLFTGMRMGEINALDINDIDFKNHLIHIRRTITRGENYRAKVGNYTKTKNGIRDIFMNEQIEQLLKKYLYDDYVANENHLLFGNSQGGAISTDTVNMIFKTFCKTYDIGQGWKNNQHMLRHTFATRCIESGMPANVLAKIMGHANVSTTLNVYCDVFDKFEKQHADISYIYLKENNLTIDFQ